MDMWSRQAGAVILAATLAAGLLPSPGVAEDKQTKSIEALAAETASTPAQHLALASYYRERAARARAEIEKHRSMALSYSSRSAGAEAGMKMHCDRLAEAAKTEAAEYDALAAFHEGEARQPAK